MLTVTDKCHGDSDRIHSHTRVPGLQTVSCHVHSWSSFLTARSKSHLGPQRSLPSPQTQLAIRGVKEAKGPSRVGSADA